MSDLHCPATLLVAGHGDADDEHGAEHVEALARSLRERRVARVYSSPLVHSVRLAQLAAQVLGVDAVAVEGLQEPRGGSGEEALDRYREALQGVADLHRGEAVLVLVHGRVMPWVLPPLSGGVWDDPAKRADPPDGALAEVSVDGDGFVVTRRPGAADRSVV